MRQKSKTASLPMPAARFSELLEALEIELNENECDHTHRVTEDFLAGADGIEPEDVLTWLIDRGGSCDCEVLADLEDEFRN